MHVGRTFSLDLEAIGASRVLIVSGCGVGDCWGSRYSGQGRAGLSGAQATGWVSDTSTVCKLSGGVGGSMGVAVTGGERAGSVSLSVSYDGRMGSSVAGVNQGAAGGSSVTVSGADFGTSR